MTVTASAIAPGWILEAFPGATIVDTEAAIGADTARESRRPHLPGPSDPEQLGLFDMIEHDNQRSM